MNKKHIVFKIMLLFIIPYLVLIIASKSGYYEKRVRERVTITEEGIKAFEEKIHNGEEIELDSFMDNDKIDYSNKISRIGDKLTSGIELGFVKTVKLFANIIKSLF